MYIRTSFYYTDLWSFTVWCYARLLWHRILRLRCSLSWRTSFAPTSFGRLDRLHRISWSESQSKPPFNHSPSLKEGRILKGMIKGQWSHGGLYRRVPMFSRCFKVSSCVPGSSFRQWLMNQAEMLTLCHWSCETTINYLHISSQSKWWVMLAEHLKQFDSFQAGET